MNRFGGKKTKIVATIGPSSNKPEIIRDMIRAGMNVARINFSHGDHETHGRNIDIIREIAKEEGAVIAILCDIQGPKIRLGMIKNEPIVLKVGDEITLTTDKSADGTDNIVALPHPEFVKDIKPGTQLLLDDGKLEFMVRSVSGNALHCEAVVAGEVFSRKGVMATNARLTLSAITEKDTADVRFALSKGTEYIAMSFVRSEQDIREMRWLIRHSSGDAQIIAKIEKHEALENIQSIIEASDGIMVARGDLGLEIPPQEVPYQQKRIIAFCNIAGKPVITATQMLNSMTDNPRPTRAEASDVYNAIMDGTDAVMLSNESAAGLYPVIAVQTMHNIATMAEKNLHVSSHSDEREIYKPQMNDRESISDAISQSTVQMADSLGCKAIITSTMTGYTAKRVAKERPKTPIICATPNELTYRRMALVWGVYPLLTTVFNTIDEMLTTVVRTAHEAKVVSENDLLAIIAGVPFRLGGQTNFIKIHTVGELDELDKE